MSFKFDIRGFAEIDKALNKRVETITKGIDNEMDRGVININARQKILAPFGQTGRLGNGNEFDISKPLNKKIENRINYAAYVEFGTGQFVKIPPGLEEIAMAFYVNGKGKMHAQPFFFQPFFEETPKMLARMIKIIAEQ